MIIKCEYCRINIERKSNSQKFCPKCQIINNGVLKKRWVKENKTKIKKYKKEYYQKNKKKIDGKSKIYRQKNKEKIDKKKKEWENRNKNKLIKYKHNWYLKNKKRLAKEKRVYYQENKEKWRIYNQSPEKKKYNKRWKKENRDGINEYQRNKIKIDKNYKIARNLRNQFLRALKHYTKTGKIMSSKKYGIDWKKVIKHLEPLPKDYTTSKNKYHIHHDKPLYTFNLIHKDGSTNLKEVSKAFSPKNHILLTIKEHKEIHRKLNHRR